MTYYSSNELNGFQVYWAQRPNEIIMRKTPTPFLSVFLKNAPMFLADFYAIKESDKRVGTAHSLDRSPAPTTSARSCTHTACCGDCTEVHLTWTTYTAQNICMSWGRSSDNMFDWEAQFANQVMNRIMDLYRDIEAATLAYCNANQTTIHNGVGGLGAWNANIWRVAIADRLQYFAYCKQMMASNSYFSTMDMINSLSIDAEYNLVNTQGTGNALHLMWQNAGLQMWGSPTLPVTAGYRGDSYILPIGSSGIVPWIPKINRDGKGDPGSTAGQWTNLISPFGDGLQFAVHITESCSDTSQTNGVVQDFVRNYEISIDISTGTTPMAGGETAIYHTGLFAT